MKRLFALIMTLFIIASFTACSGGDFYDGLFNSDIEGNNSATLTEDTTEYISTDAPVTDSPTDTPTESSVTPLLYKVTDDEGNYLWILGTIHVATDCFYPLPDYVLDAYESADSLAVECDIKAFESDYTAQVEAMTPMMYSDGSLISDYISEETYEKAKEVLTHYGLYVSYMDYFKPIMWYSTIDSALVEDAGAKFDLGIDSYFLNDAYNTGKKILEMESVQFQYEMLANYSDELQCALLEDALYYYDNFDMYKADIETMMELWCAGDEKRFAEYLNTEPEFENEEDEALYEEYNTAMITDRNIGMTDFAEEQLISKEKVFICVGAAHVVGDGGMADQLAKRGYKVEIVR